MSTTTYDGTLDVSTTARVPVSRLIQVELRKMIDTRAGLWLMFTALIITVPASLIFGLVASDADKEFGAFVFFAYLPQGFLLPVLGILLVTQEWGQRTAMVTFTLEPNRGRVLIAKIAAAAAVGLLAFLFVLAFAAVVSLAFGADFTGLTFGDTLKLAMLQVLGVVMGAGFGLLLLNSAAAIVVFFVVPNLVTFVASVWSALRDAQPWIDFNTSQGALIDNSPTGEEWAQFLVTTVIWVVLPIVVGSWRMLRAELK